MDVGVRKSRCCSEQIGFTLRAFPGEKVCRNSDGRSFHKACVNMK